MEVGQDRRGREFNPAKSSYLLSHDSIDIGKILASNELKLPIVKSLRKGLENLSISEFIFISELFFLNAVVVHTHKLKFSSTAVQVPSGKILQMRKFWTPECVCK